MMTDNFPHLTINFCGWTITHIFLASVGLAQARPNKEEQLDGYYLDL